MFQDIFLAVVTVILLIAPIFDWIATIVLHNASNKSGEDSFALRERAKMAFVLATSNTINGFLAACRILSIVLGPTFVFLLGISLVLSSVPNMYWLISYTRKWYAKRKKSGR